MPTATEVSEQAPSVARETGTALVAVVVAVALAYGWSFGFFLDNAHNGLLGGSFTAVGLYVVRMRPRHREGRLLLATGVLHAGMFFARQYGLHEAGLPAASWVGWLGVWPLPLVIATAGWTLMAFPDGRLPSPRWRVAVVVMFAVAFVLAVASGLWPVEYARMGFVAAHPLDVPGGDVAARFWSYAQPASYVAFRCSGPPQSSCECAARGGTSCARCAGWPTPSSWPRCCWSVVCCCSAAPCRACSRFR